MGTDLLSTGDVSVIGAIVVAALLVKDAKVGLVSCLDSTTPVSKSKMYIYGEYQITKAESKTAK